MDHARVDVESSHPPGFGDFGAARRASWDPQQRVIVFWYVDAKGSLTKGTVKMEDGKLVHQFQETESDGKTADYVARVTPHGNEAWDNEIFARKGNGLTPLVKVRYEVAQ